MAGLGLDLARTTLLPAPQSRPAFGGRDPQALAKAAREFEAMFLGEMLRPMFEQLSVPEPFGGGLGEDVWRSVQVTELGKAISRMGGIGLSVAVMRDLMAAQHGGGES